ncbi:glutathione S-transferase [Billgrantia pellis]|uniref:Glutathione S-transferase n=1 Tax=Billgrantia pellis TaxID=2606936 RepID=A0A7V7G3D7_9GAMM|nr:glutathione S-transferase [Halomonas pellis]KAA0014592.1 glutathione S-transferase [Halomonas pellis]
MKLFYSPASPYVRKVMVMAHETGQEVDKLDSAASPINRDQKIVDHNPTGKVPTAILPDGSALYDSRVICRWLDAQHAGPKMYPEGNWDIVRQEALADGLLDAALLARYETVMRPEEMRWPEWLQGQMDKIASSLDTMETEAESLKDVNAGSIAIGCAVAYLDFRFPDYPWRTSRPQLTRWYEAFSQRASFQMTQPNG